MIWFQHFFHLEGFRKVSAEYSNITTVWDKIFVIEYFGTWLDHVVPNNFFQKYHQILGFIKSRTCNKSCTNHFYAKS